MLTQQDLLLADISGSLLDHTTEGGIQLIENILSIWGTALAHDQSSLPEELDGTYDMVVRYPAMFMWNELGAMGLVRKQGAAQSETAKKQYDPASMFPVINDWASELAKRPLRATIHSFTTLVQNWLQVCDLEQYTRQGYTEESALADIYRRWGGELGVD
jgi:hypothetical protein